jgi:hypothetical protein
MPADFCRVLELLLSYFFFGAQICPQVGVFALGSVESIPKLLYCFLIVTMPRLETFQTGLEFADGIDSGLGHALNSRAGSFEDVLEILGHLTPSLVLLEQPEAEYEQ